MSDKTKHIQGWEHQNSLNNSRVFSESPFNLVKGNSATLTIWEGERERLFTESEVRAMLEEIKKADYYYGEGNTIEAAATKLGLPFNNPRNHNPLNP